MPRSQYGDQNIINNFEKASTNYNRNAIIQKEFALRLARECANNSIPKGFWTDLGAGTGLLSEALENLHPNQTVLRADGSQGMLTQQTTQSNYQLWNLNLGLPPWQESPTLIASSFALHWLSEPTKRLQEWLTALHPSGWLALAVPIEGSFPEWSLAASKAGVRFTALPLPPRNQIIDVLNKASFRPYQKVHKVTQEHRNVFSLLKSITSVGAQATPKRRLKTGEMRKLIRAWPHNENTRAANLTWKIQIALVQK